MDIDKPKPWHGWREFLKEVGTIVLGVLIAIGLEQAVETLHHQDQARQMVRKLLEESLENRQVIAYDLSVCQAEIVAADRDIDVVSRAIQDRRLSTVVIAPMPPGGLYRPANAAWITIRDRALLPIMPKLAIDNAWKVDQTDESMSTHAQEAGRNYRRLQSVIAASRQRPLDEALADDILLKLDEFRTDEMSYCALTALFRDANETSLAGRRIDMGDVRKAHDRYGG